MLGKVYSTAELPAVGVPVAATAVARVPFADIAVPVAELGLALRALLAAVASELEPAQAEAADVRIAGQTGLGAGTFEANVAVAVAVAADVAVEDRSVLASAVGVDIVDMVTVEGAVQPSGWSMRTTFVAAQTVLVGVVHCKSLSGHC